MERSTELKDAYLKLCQAMASGDMDTFSQGVSRQDGVTMLGTDPQERWLGYHTIVHIFAAQAAQMGGGLPVAPGDPQAFVEGTVGWVEDPLNFNLPDGQQMPIRAT